jgi:hypothetical protein
VEETIGYEALFTPEEWDSIDFVDWDPPEGGGPDRKHSVSVAVVDDGYELACESCDFFEHTSDVTEADNLKRLHEEFVATVVERLRADQ